MSKEHVVKTLTKFFEPACDGRKPFEVRINDRDYEVGDVLVQKEWDPIGGFSGYETRSTITYVLDDPAYCPSGYVVLGLRDPRLEKKDAEIERWTWALRQTILIACEQGTKQMTEIQDVNLEIIRQRERIRKLEDDLHFERCRNQDLQDRNSSDRKEIERLREPLRFYADESTYVVQDSGEGAWFPFHKPIFLDKGQRAQAALKGAE